MHEFFIIRLIPAFVDQERSYREELEEKENRLNRLQDILRKKEEEIASMKEEEIQRAVKLQSAVLSYVNSVKSQGKSF